MENERKITVNIALPISLVEKIDKKRGRTSRSEILRRLVLENCDLSKIKAV
jgi:metal-responsive CopG/Arc/MetJ family transcriptional regulator